MVGQEAWGLYRSRTGKLSESQGGCSRTSVSATGRINKDDFTVRAPVVPSEKVFGVGLEAPSTF